jgi:hypothetical protein
VGTGYWAILIPNPQALIPNPQAIIPMKQGVQQDDDVALFHG